LPSNPDSPCCPGHGDAKGCRPDKRISFFCFLFKHALFFFFVLFFLVLFFFFCPNPKMPKGGSKKEAEEVRGTAAERLQALLRGPCGRAATYARPDGGAADAMGSAVAMLHAALARAVAGTRGRRRRLGVVARIAAGPGKELRGGGGTRLCFPIYMVQWLCLVVIVLFGLIVCLLVCFRLLASFAIPLSALVVGSRACIAELRRHEMRTFFFRFFFFKFFFLTVPTFGRQKLPL
jgi:hypothetical protein